jgi:hypothetical protein
VKVNPLTRRLHKHATKVLIVEDLSPLGLSGCFVRPAAGWLLALQLPRGRPEAGGCTKMDVAVVDGSLGGGRDGVECAVSRWVFLTAQTDGETKQRAGSVNPASYLQKPVHSGSSRSFVSQGGAPNLPGSSGPEVGTLLYRRGLRRSLHMLASLPVARSLRAALVLQLEEKLRDSPGEVKRPLTGRVTGEAEYCLSACSDTFAEPSADPAAGA